VIHVNAHRTTVHPHVRGEHEMNANRYIDIPGSSPRAWGASDLRRSASTSMRFIPTCVGSICMIAWRVRRKTVHPHVRGEHTKPNPHAGRACGSSPRAWGACDTLQFGAGNTRFIPTCVGSI